MFRNKNICYKDGYDFSNRKVLVFLSDADRTFINRSYSLTSTLYLADK